MIFLRILVILLLSNTSSAKEPEAISAASFIAQNHSIEREEIINYITHQFDVKSKFGVSQTELDNIWSDLKLRNALHMIRFQIIKQKLYADSFYVKDLRFKKLLVYFQKLLDIYKIDDVDFIVDVSDELPDEFKTKIANLPFFMLSKDSAQNNIFLLPDTYMIDGYWAKLSAKIEVEKGAYPWKDKLNKIFWRGATTGGRYSLDNFNKLPRLSLVMQSKLYPDLIDAKFLQYNQFSEDQSGDDLRGIFAKLFGDDNKKIKEIDHLKYKYLISLDGNTCAWRRVPWIMLSNSVLIKQETNMIEWFYAAMKPYVHYVPVNSRITDIFSQLEWMKAHDDELQQISQNAQNFVQNNLMPEHIAAHSAIILNEYHKLHQDKKLIATLPKAEDTLAKISKIYKIKKQFMDLIP